MLGFVLHYIKIQKEVMKKKLNTGREQKYVSKDVPYQLQVLGMQLYYGHCLN